MPRFSRAPLSRMISLRVTPEQDEYLEQLAAALQLPGGKAELLRKALDYWLEHASEAAEAGQKPEGRESEG